MEYIVLFVVLFLGLNMIVIGWHLIKLAWKSGKKYKKFIDSDDTL